MKEAILLVIFPLCLFGGSYSDDLIEIKKLPLEQRIEPLNQLVNELDSAGIKDTLSTIYYFLARYNFDVGSFEESSINSKKAIALYQTLGLLTYRLHNSYLYLLKSQRKLQEYEHAKVTFSNLVKLDINDLYSNYAIENAHYEMKLIYEDLGDFPSAISLMQSLINSSVYNLLTSVRKSYCHYNISVSYSKMSDANSLIKCKNHLDTIGYLKNQSLSLGERWDPKLDKIVLYQSSYNSMYLGNYKEARKGFESFIALENENSLYGVEALNSIANTYRLEGNYQECIAKLRPITLTSNMKNISSATATKILGNLGWSYRGINVDSARYYLHQSINVLLARDKLIHNNLLLLAKDLAAYPDVIYNLIDLAELEYSAGNDSLSLEYLVISEFLATKLLQNQEFHKSLLLWRERLEVIYNLGIKLASGLNRKDYAWKFCERSKNLALLDVIRSNKGVKGEGEGSKYNSIEYLSSNLNKDESQLTTVDIYGLQNQSAPFFIIQYFQVKDTVFVLQRKPDATLQVSRFEFSDLNEKIELILECIAHQKIEDCKEILSHIFIQLFESQSIPFGSSVTIIPSGALSFLPFGVLKNYMKSGSSYIEENYIIQYQHSATLMLELMKFHHFSSGIATFAPTFNQKSDEVYASMRGLIGDDIELYHLPNAKKEANFISGLWDKNPIPVSKDAVVTAIKENRIFHFSGHSIGFVENSDLSFLALGSDLEEPNSKLQLMELYNLECNNEMVVLSACETATGKYSAGEGVLSLSRGFFYAGAKSVISTLWSINDQSSAFIMTEFYKELKKGKRKDEALRQAKLTYLDQADPEYQHPYYWAAFIAMGDMSPLFFPYRKYKIGGVAICSLLILGFAFRKNQQLAAAA